MPVSCNHVSLSVPFTYKLETNTSKENDYSNEHVKIYIINRMIFMCILLAFICFSSIRILFVYAPFQFVTSMYFDNIFYRFVQSTMTLCLYSNVAWLASPPFQ